MSMITCVEAELMSTLPTWLLQSVEEEFADAFGAGTFRDQGANPEAAETTDISERITVIRDDKQSHTAGFEVNKNCSVADWCNSCRGPSKTQRKQTCIHKQATRIDLLKRTADGSVLSHFQ